MKTHWFPLGFIIRAGYLFLGGFGVPLGSHDFVSSLGAAGSPFSDSAPVGPTVAPDTRHGLGGSFDLNRATKKGRRFSREGFFFHGIFWT